MAKAKPPKAVTASAFNLESNGKIVATLGVFSGQPDLAFFDSTGKLVVAMGITGVGQGAGISVYDGNAAVPGGTGKARVAVGVVPTENAEGIETFTAAGAVQSSVGSAEDGTFSGGSFYDASGGLRAGIRVRSWPPRLTSAASTQLMGTDTPCLRWAVRLPRRPRLTRKRTNPP